MDNIIIALLVVLVCFLLGVVYSQRKIIADQASLLDKIGKGIAVQFKKIIRDDNGEEKDKEEKANEEKGGHEQLFECPVGRKNCQGSASFYPSEPLSKSCPGSDGSGKIHTNCQTVSDSGAEGDRI